MEQVLRNVIGNKLYLLLNFFFDEIMFGILHL